MRQNNNKNNFRHAIATAGSAGLTILGMTGLGLWLGIKIDELFEHEHSWGLVLGGLVGAFWGIYGMIYKMIHK